jgi:hypothetical protein
MNHRIDTDRMDGPGDAVLAEVVGELLPISAPETKHSYLTEEDITKMLSS